MASSKEPTVTSSRPLSQHRPASATTPMNVPGRHSNPRSHSHSLSVGTMNSGHRVTRRKSMTSNNFAAAAAAVKGMDEASLEALTSPDNKPFSVKIGNSMHQADSSLAARDEVPASYGGFQYLGSDNGGTKEDALAKEPGSTGLSKARNRRASEGAHLGKSEGKRVSGELKCDKCGKGYKHSSCLTKHLWEHTPEWQFTSKLLISKHQQVQLLEAASVLVNMNQDAPGVDAFKAIDSDNSSASPDASGSSEIHDDDISSAETTPPPMSEQVTDSKRFSTASSVFSRSYQSTHGMSLGANSMPSSSYGSFHGTRPSTSGTTYSAMPIEDEAGLAAAVKLVNFGTPRSNATQMDDVPPVPPLPARYASHNASHSVGGSIYSFANEFRPQAPSHQISDERDVTMSNGQKHEEDDFDDVRSRRSVSRSRSDDHEEGFFGRMEE